MGCIGCKCIITSTYSYESKQEALAKMLEQLRDLNIPYYIDGRDDTYYVVEEPIKRVNLSLSRTTDFWGKLYYVCQLDAN